MGGVLVNYKHTLYATAIVMLGTIGGTVALGVLGKDSAALIAAGGAFVTALIQVLNAKQMDDVKREVNGHTAKLIEKIPDPEAIVIPPNADGSPLTPFQQGRAVAEFRAGERAGAASRRARCPFPGCLLAEGGHSH